MEVLAITVLSIFAFIGLVSVKSYLFSMLKSRHADRGIKLMLYIPPESRKLEGIIRQIFIEEIPQRLMTDGKLYTIVPNSNDETKKLLESLKDQYPIEVLPDSSSYGMIQDREKNDSILNQ
jgi:hypothetical protein